MTFAHIPEVEEVTGPIYGWRGYFIHNTGVFGCFLLPMWQRFGEHGETRAASMIDWTHADEVPVLYRYYTDSTEVPHEVLIDKRSYIYDVDSDSGAPCGHVPVRDTLAVTTIVPDKHGIHAFTSREDAVVYILSNRLPIESLVLAKVELGGEMIVHEHGYRAQKSRLVELYHHSEDRSMRSLLADLLGWPFEIDHFKSDATNPGGSDGTSR